MIKKKYEFIIKRKLKGFENVLKWFPFCTFSYIEKEYIYDEMYIITGETMDEIEQKKEEIWKQIIIDNYEKLRKLPKNEWTCYICGENSHGWQLWCPESQSHFCDYLNGYCMHCHLPEERNYVSDR